MNDFIQHVINGLAAGTIYALVALGYTMVYGVLKLINFAHGDVMMVGVYMGYATARQSAGEGATSSFLGVTALILTTLLVTAVLGLLINFGTRRTKLSAVARWAANFLVALALVMTGILILRMTGLVSLSGMRAVFVFVVATVGCAVLGFLIERLAYRPLRDKPRLTALITAIGISFTLSYGFQLDIGFLPGASPRAFPEIIKPTEWLIIGDYDVVIWNWQVISFAIAIGLMVGLQFLVFGTRFGRAMRAVSFDHRIAGLMGIPVDRVIAFTFMLGSGLAAVAGILYAIKDTAVQPLMGMYVGLKAFVAAVIGGIGHVPGAVVGALLLGLIEEFVVGYTASSWRDAVAFGILIIVLLARPEGIFGRVAAEKV